VSEAIELVLACTHAALRRFARREPATNPITT